MNDVQLSQLSALTALNALMRADSFNICTIREVIKLLGTTPDGQALKILEPLHCMRYGDMPAELREAIPKLIERCIAVPAYQFQITPAEAARVQSATIRLLTR